MMANRVPLRDLRLLRLRRYAGRALTSGAVTMLLFLATVVWGIAAASGAGLLT
jgi:hypothetical protein